MRKAIYYTLCVPAFVLAVLLSMIGWLIEKALDGLRIFERRGSQ